MPAHSSQDLFLALCKALKSGDLDAAAGLYDDEAVFVVSPGRIARGKEEVRDALAGFIALKPTLVIDPVEVVSTGDIALVLGSWTLSGTGEDGMPVLMSGRSSDVHRRRDGVWRILVDNPWGTGVLPG